MPHSANTPHDRPAPGAPLPREVAEDILRRHGLDAAGLAPEELKRHRQSLARPQHHPDLDGDMPALREFNAAYSSLKPHDPAVGRDTTSPRVRGAPVWAWAGHGGGAAPGGLIQRDDYSDRNFLKKRLWELSGRSTEEWILWAFDGQDLLPPVATYGSAAIFPEMAEAMLRHGRRGFRGPRAVLAQAAGERHALLLLHVDGRRCAPPVKLPLSGATGPAQDRAFLMALPGRLDALAAGWGF